MWVSLMTHVLLLAESIQFHESIHEREPAFSHHLPLHKVSQPFAIERQPTIQQNYHGNEPFQMQPETTTTAFNLL